MSLCRSSIISIVFGLAIVVNAQDNRPTVDVLYTKIIDDSNPFGVRPNFAHGTVNDYGQVLVTGYFARTGRSGNGIYLSDQSGLRKVIEESDSLDGGTVQSLAATPAMDGPNAYFMGSGVVGFAATVRVGARTYFGFYRNSSSRPARFVRLARQEIGVYGSFNCSADAAENGNWAFSAQGPDGRFSVSFGTRNSVTNIPAPISFSANGYTYNLVGADMIKADQKASGGAFLNMTGQPTVGGVNQQSGLLSFPAGVPTLFTDRVYQLPFKAGNGITGGVSYLSGVPQMIVSLPGSTSIRDDGTSHYELAPRFQMNAAGITTTWARNTTTSNDELLWSNEYGLTIIPNSGVIGAPGINSAGYLAYPWVSSLITWGLEMQAPVQFNHQGLGSVPFPTPVVLQYMQPLFGDYLYHFQYEPTRNFNKYNEVVVKYMLTSNEWGLVKVKLDVPLITSYIARFDPVSGQTTVTVAGDNFNPANQYQLYVQTAGGAQALYQLLPTANPRVWTSNIGAIPRRSLLVVDVEKTGGDYATPGTRIRVR